MEELRRIQEEIEERRRAQEAAEARARAEAEELARKEEEERLRAIEERRKRSYVEWFGMNIFEMMELVVSTDLDRHMSELIRQYQKATQDGQDNTNNASELYHILNKIKANHLVFTRLQRNAFKYLFDKGMIFMVEAGRYVYQQKRPCKTNIYFVLYGELEHRMPEGYGSDAERFGERVTLGFSVGEEVLFEKPPLRHRIESMAATVATCLLQVDMKLFVNMDKRPADGGGSTQFREDKKQLMDLMQQLYFIKNLWRYDAGLIAIPPMMEPWMKKQE